MCPFDQHRLETSGSSDGLSEPLECRASRWFPPEVLLQIAAWLVTNLVFGIVFSVAGILLVQVACSCWAAYDCAKIQTRGTRVLGIVFKPVVAFGVCAFLLWGLGFAWYLVMRHRVRSEPVELPGERQHLPA